MSLICHRFTWFSIHYHWFQIEVLCFLHVLKFPKHMFIFCEKCYWKKKLHSMHRKSWIYPLVSIQYKLSVSGMCLSVSSANWMYPVVPEGIQCTGYTHAVENRVHWIHSRVSGAPECIKCIFASDAWTIVKHYEKLYFAWGYLVQNQRIAAYTQVRCTAYPQFGSTG